MKKTEIDTLFVRSLYRFLGNLIAGKIKNTKITPNQVTIIGLIIGLLAGLFILTGQSLLLIAAGLLLQINVILDFVDGSLAHLTGRETVLGDWLDRNAGIPVDSFLIFSLTLRSYLATPREIIWIMGFFCLIWRYLLRTLFDASIFATARIKPFQEDLRSGAKRRLLVNIMKEFIPTRYFTLLLATLFVIFNRMDWFLIIFSCYGFLAYLVISGITYKKIARDEQKSTI